jgi:hypothetical protein
LDSDHLTSHIRVAWSFLRSVLGRKIECGETSLKELTQLTPVKEANLTSIIQGRLTVVTTIDVLAENAVSDWVTKGLRLPLLLAGRGLDTGDELIKPCANPAVRG